MSSLTESARARPCILVIDDDPAIHQAMKIRLGSEFRVASTLDPREAVARALEEKPDLILCDINMRGMTGDEVAHALSLEDGTSRIPLVYLTGLLDARGRLELAPQFGDHRAISKAATTSQLRELVREVLDLDGPF